MLSPKTEKVLTPVGGGVLKPKFIVRHVSKEESERHQRIRRLAELNKDDKYYQTRYEKTKPTSVPFPLFQKLLTDTIPDAAERDRLLNTPQNSAAWLLLRRKFIGASEEDAFHDCSRYRGVDLLMNSKHGLYGFDQDPFLPFEVGHLAEDHSGFFFKKVCTDVWKLPDFELGHPGILPDRYRRARWVSIDAVPKTEDPSCFLSWDFLQKWDPEWKCGWRRSSSTGIHFRNTLLELKTAVYNIPPDAHICHADPGYIRQCQCQMKASLSNADLVDFRGRRYAFLSKLQPPFTTHDERYSSMSVRIDGRGLWWVHIWVTAYDPAYWERAIPREKHFMAEYDRRAGTTFDYNAYVPFEYPPELPAPETPAYIYLGSYAFTMDGEDAWLDLNTKVAREGGTVELPDIAKFSLVEKTADGRAILESRNLND